MNINALKTTFSLFPLLLIVLINITCEITHISFLIRFVIVFIVCISSFVLIIFNKKIPKLFNKLFNIINFFTLFALIIYVLLYNYDLLKYFSSITAIKELIISTGSKGSIIFILIQIAQVIFLPIPAAALLIVGIIIYGSLKTTIFCTFGVLIGSYVSFIIGKTFGLKFAYWFLGEDRVKKYTNILQYNGKFILSLVFIFPFFPDDLFCIVAGMSSMTFKEFFIISTLIRPIPIILMCLFGGGSIFSINSIPGIILLIVIFITSMFLLFRLKNSKRIRSLLKNKKG